jgi:hypothetical protein
LRDHYDDLRDRGAELVLIGTGNADYALSFARDLEVAFPVLVDDDARAARAASVRRVSALQLFHPASYPGTRQAWRAGHRIGWPGKRTNQLGASFVLGPGPVVHYGHHDAHTADHAPLSEILATLDGR